MSIEPLPTQTIKISVTNTYEISVKQTPTGWWEAWHGVLGSTSASTKEEALRILKDRAEGK